MKIVKIPHFEQCNPHVSINVIKYTPPLKFKRIKIIEESIKHPYFELVYRSMHQSEGGCQIIYLLLVENNENHYRYMAITNLKRMLIVAKGTKYYDNVCFSCLRLFRSKSTLDEHNSMCAISKDIQSYRQSRCLQYVCVCVRLYPFYDHVLFITNILLLWITILHL